MNVIASSLGIKGSPEKLLYQLIDKYSSAAPLDISEVSSLNVNGQYGFVFGTGMVPRVLTEYYKNKTGAVGAALLILRIWFSGLIQGPFFKKIIQSETFLISLDDGPATELQNLAVFASVVKKLPLGFRFFKKLSGKTGVFEELSVICEPKHLLWKLPGILALSRCSPFIGKQSSTCTKLKLDSNQTIHYTLDGELFEQGNQLRLDLGPTFRFILL